MTAHRYFVLPATRQRDAEAWAALVFGAAQCFDPDDRLPPASAFTPDLHTAHHEAAKARGYKCRFCGQHSTLATCRDCAEEAGW